MLICVLPADGPFGKKHVVNKSPIYITNSPLLCLATFFYNFTEDIVK